MTGSQIKQLQLALNFFTKKYLYSVAPILVDGRWGPSTRERIRMIKYYLGYLGPINSIADHSFRSRLWHPKSVRYSSLARVRRGMRRRVQQRKRAHQHQNQVQHTTGVTTFDGVPVAAWMTRYLQWARAHGGWRGALVSGFRDPAYSESLCYRMCGKPSCPGLCAGRTSNHSGKELPHGAVDVTDYVRFGVAMRQCPYTPRIFNNLPRDLVHFSATGN